MAPHRPTALDLEEAYARGLLPPRAREAYERLAWALDVEPEELGAHLARLGLPERGWVLTLGLVGWRPGVTPPGAEALAQEGLLDLGRARLTRKGLFVHEALEVLVWALSRLRLEGGSGPLQPPQEPVSPDGQPVDPLPSTG